MYSSGFVMGGAKALLVPNVIFGLARKYSLNAFIKDCACVEFVVSTVVHTFSCFQALHKSHFGLCSIIQ